MFAKFLCLAWRNDVVCFLFCFEVGFCERNVCFRGVVIVPCDGGLISDGRLKAVTVERTIVLLSAAACFVGFAVFVIFRVR